MNLTEKDARLVARAMRVLEQHARYNPVALTSPAAVRDYLRLRFSGCEREEFHVMYLNNQNQLIEARTEFLGTLTQTAVYPREIAKSALMLNAAAVILAHNHPSGTPEPSAADRLLTQALKAALAQLDVQVLDHIIVTETRTTSFAEQGLL